MVKINFLRRVPLPAGISTTEGLFLSFVFAETTYYLSQIPSSPYQSNKYFQTQSSQNHLNYVCVWIQNEVKRYLLCVEAIDMQYSHLFDYRTFPGFTGPWKQRADRQMFIITQTPLKQGHSKIPKMEIHLNI